LQWIAVLCCRNDWQFISRPRIAPGAWIKGNASKTSQSMA
jgi:hypothetical protein